MLLLLPLLLPPLLLCSSIILLLLLLPAKHPLRLVPPHPPNHRDSIHHGVNLPMHTQAQDRPRQHDPTLQDRPHKCHNHCAQQSLTTPPRTNRRNHRIPQPHCRHDLSRARLPQRIVPPQHPQHPPPRRNVPRREEDLAEASPSPGRGEKKVCEEWRVPVGFSRVGGLSLREEL